MGNTQLRKKLRIPNPLGSKDIHMGPLKEILRQVDISQDEWDKI